MSLNISLRPKRFDELLGNQETVDSLRAVIEKGNPPRAMMFYGPPGCGKTTAALIYARLIQKGTTDTPEIIDKNAADTNGVDDMRLLVEQTASRPFMGQYRVVILDEAQQLTSQAQNVLLKATEAESSSTLFIFCTTAPEKLIPALKQRCIPYQFKPLIDSDVAILMQRAGVFPSTNRVEPILAADIKAPREILTVCERILAGMSVEEAILSPELQPDYIEIARCTAKGQWQKVQPILAKMKTADVRGLRSVVGGYLKTILLKEPVGDKANVLADCLTALATYNTMEDGVAFAVTVGYLYKCCRRLNPPPS